MKKFIPLIAALTAVACMGGNNEAVNKSITNINEELVVVQKSITDNQMSIEDLKASSSTASADISANADAIAELRAEIVYLQNELMAIKGGAAPVASDGENSQPAEAVLTDVSAENDDQQIIIIEDSSAAKNSLYSYAIELNRQKKYSEARDKFQEFIDKYPNDELVGNAQYWIGETYYSVNDMNTALAAFEDVLKKYPNSKKVPDAMLKIAYVYDNLGDREKAQSDLKNLINQYPKSKPASLAVQKLKSWGVN